MENQSGSFFVEDADLVELSALKLARSLKNASGNAMDLKLPETAVKPVGQQKNLP